MFLDVEPGQPLMSDLHEMRHFEYMVVSYLGLQVRREIFGDISWIGEEELASMNNFYHHE